MLTSFSMWAIYFASYLTDYILILGIIIWKHALEAKETGAVYWKNADIITWGVLLIFIGASILITNKVRSIKMNSRIKYIPEENITIEILSYVVPQMFVIGTSIVSEWWMPIDLCIFFITGIIFVHSGKVYNALLFVFPLNNKIYRSGKSVIITKYKLEEMRITQEDAIDGIEARELAKDIYYVRKQK